MERRRFVRILGAASACGLAGCNQLGLSNDALSTQDSFTHDRGHFPCFGDAVSATADGKTVVVGAAWLDASTGDTSQGAFVFSRRDGTWIQQANLLPDDVAREAAFGASVAIAGDGGTAIITARADEIPNRPNQGSAYVFSRNGDEWRTQAKLTNSADDSDEDFGSSAALSDDGTTAIIGARDASPGNTKQGSAAVFSREDGDWNQEATLVPDDGDSADQFGSSVALTGDGNTAVIAAVSDEDPNGIDAGSAYVFSREDGSWREQAKLAAEDGDVEDGFGTSVAIADEAGTAVIGAPFDDENGGWSGSAYVFSQNGGEWRQRATLVPEDGDSQDLFGRAVAVTADGETVIAGANFDEDPNGEGSGSVYQFRREDGSWHEKTKFAPDDADDWDGFGASVAMSDDGKTVFVGTPADDTNNDGNVGSVYVLESSQ